MIVPMKFKSLLGTAIAACAALGIATSAAAAGEPPRDGRHDFDFALGQWKTQIRRNMTPLSGRSEFVDMKGTVRVRPVWGGKACLEEIEADGPQGHWQAMTLFLYDPQSRQWSQSFANSARGTLDSTMVGSFTDGRIELYQQDRLAGRAILVRATWFDITPTSHSYREDYSDDGGKTWDTAFVAHLTREAP
jgi:hypothetical protein